MGTLCAQHLQLYADSLDIIRDFVRVGKCACGLDMIIRLFLSLFPQVSPFSGIITTCIKLKR